jgi:hypothetical protein
MPNEEMSGEAQRSPLDLLVLPQPRDFYPGKMDKIIKFQRTCAAAVAYPHQRLLCAYATAAAHFGQFS